MLRIRVAWPSGEAEFFNFDSPEVTIGRSKENQLTLREASGVSRAHALISVDDGVVYIEDLGSTNGTLVNSEQVKKVKIEPHDVVEIGDVWLRIGLEGAAERSLEKYPLNNKGISKLKQLSTSEPQELALSPVGESRMISALSAAMPKLWELVNRPNVQNVLVDNNKTVATFIDGTRENVGILFDEKILEGLKHNFQIFLSEASDHDGKVLSASLQNGLSISLIVPPVSRTGTILLLEKSFVDNYSLNELSDLGAIQPAIAKWLKQAVVENKRLLISGVSHDACLSLAQAISRFIRQDQDVCVIDSMNKFVLSRMDIQTIDPTNLSAAELTTFMRIIVRAGTDYFIVGDLSAQQGGEILKELAAGNSGSISCIRSRSVDQALARLELTIGSCYAGGSGVEALTHEVAASVDAIIHLDSNCNSVPKIDKIVQISSVNSQGELVLKELFNSKATNGTQVYARDSFDERSAKIIAENKPPF